MPTLSAADFAPVTAQLEHNQIAKPSLTYWQRVWLRLRAHRGAMISLWLIVALLLFTLLGPFIWRVDPGAQNLQQISQAPQFSNTAILVEDSIAFEPIISTSTQSFSGTLTTPQNLELIGTANTEAVFLRWQPVAGATDYRIYRHELAPSGPTDLGLPLGETGYGDHVSYRDGLALTTRNYYYTVVAVRDQQTAHSQPIKVNVQAAIPVSAALEQQLINAEQIQDSLGSAIQLPANPFGTDALGRDMLARLIQGARVSLFIGIFAPLLFISFGAIYGGISGYIGGRVDDIMMRIADFVIALPFLLFMILFKVVFGIGPGESGIMPMLVAMVLLSWPGSARLVRGQTLQIREEAFLQAARMMGAKPTYLLRKHILPNVVSVLLVSISFAIPSAIFTEAFLSFIGMGVVPPTPSWGSMCNDGIQSMLTHPHELLFPALFISITVLAFNLLGDGLRDAFDVRTKIDQ